MHAKVQTNTQTHQNSLSSSKSQVSKEISRKQAASRKETSKEVSEEVSRKKESTSSSKASSDKSASSHRATRQVRRSQIHLWVPNQHGAWMMVLCPPLSGLLAGGFSGFGLWLCITWLICYLASYAVGRWLISRRAKRFFRPAIVYSAIVLLLGIPLVVLQPNLLWWSPVYLVILVAHLWASHSRNQRSLWANGTAVVGSGLTALLTVSLGNSGADSPFPVLGMVIALAYILQEFGVVLFVKTMFRERGSKPYFVASLLWHVMLCGLGFWVSWPTGVAAVLLLARAAILPAYAKRLNPLQIGLFEIAVSVTSFIGITWGATLTSFV